MTTTHTPARSLIDLCDCFYICNTDSSHNPDVLHLPTVDSDTTRMGGKRKLNDDKFTSRGESLSKSTRPRNVCAGITLEETYSRIGCQERRFSRKLVLPTDPDCLVALVQMNDICMLVCREAADATAVKYCVTASSISGKKKKVQLFFVVCQQYLFDP